VRCPCRTGALHISRPGRPASPKSELAAPIRGRLTWVGITTPCEAHVVWTRRPGSIRPVRSYCGGRNPGGGRSLRCGWETVSDGVLDDAKRRGCGDYQPVDGCSGPSASRYEETDPNRAEQKRDARRRRLGGIDAISEIWCTRPGRAHDTCGRVADAGSVRVDADARLRPGEAQNARRKGCR
jgi:hypothetical protein